MIATSPDRSDLCDSIIPSVLYFASQISRLGLRLSHKGAIVTSDLNMSRQIQKELQDNGIAYQVQIHAHDLGVTFSMHKPSKRSLLNSRLVNVSGRTVRITELAQIDRKARNLHSGSAFPFATFGHEACGFDQCRLQQLEIQAAHCTGIKTAGRCRFFALAVGYGVRGTPKHKIIFNLIKMWFQTLHATLADTPHNDVRLAWASARNHINETRLKKCQELEAGRGHDKQTQCNSAVYGIMSNVISLLFNVNWIPRSYNAWETPDGAVWTLTDSSVAPHIIAHLIIDASTRIELQRAKHHMDGKGIEGGVNWFSTLSLHRAWKKQSEHYAELCALETIMCGATWPNARVSEAYPDIPAVCSRCGTAPDTSLHAFWECPANANIDSPEVQDTQKYISAAVHKSPECPCFWLRGIVPESFTEIDNTDLPPNVLIASEENMFRPDFDSGTYYGDASGGKFTSFPVLRRIGVGVVQVDVEANLVWGHSFNLPGPIQTVPRGELFAILYVIQRTSYNKTIHFVTDNLKVAQKYNEGKDSALLSTNCDLFKELFEILHTRNIKLTVRWMPSHLLETGHTPPESVSRIDILANDLADKQAGKAAKRHEISLNISTSFIYYHYLARRIQKRLSKIITCLPNRHKRKVPKQMYKISPSLEDRFADSLHFPFLDHGKVRCARCLDCLPSFGPTLCKWLKSECINLDFETDRPTPYPKEFIQIGKQTSHPSHRLCQFNGLIFCRRCGYYGKNRMIHLASPCDRPGQQGLANLVALRAGRLPQGLFAWPMQTLTPGQIEAHSLLRSVTEVTPEDVQSLRRFAHDFCHCRDSQETVHAHIHSTINPEDEHTHRQQTNPCVQVNAPTIIPHRSSWAGFDDSQTDSSSD